MKKAILDTNFILTCIKQKIDFFEELYLMGIQIIIPQEVINEIIKVSNSNQKQHSKDAAKLALELLEKSKFEKIELGKGHVDKKILGYVNKNPEIIIATLDKELQDKISGKKMIIREKKRLEIR
jgi:rRNA-processing protein FCF1